MTNRQLDKLFRLNDDINQLKRNIKEYLNAPVWNGSLYDEEFQAMDTAEADKYLLAKEIWTIIPDEVARLARLAQQRREILACK